MLGVKNKDEAPAAAWAFGNALVQLGFQAEIQGAVPNLIPDAQTFLIRVAPKQ